METTQLWLCLHYREDGGSLSGDVVHKEQALRNPYLAREDSDQVWAQSLKANTLTALT